MIFTNSITNAVFTVISSDQTVVNSNINIDRYQILNSDINRTPWVGIYAPEGTIDPFRANITQPWMAEISIPVFIQAGLTKDTEQAQNELDLLQTAVLTAVNCSRELLNTVNIIKGFSFVPFDEIIDKDNVIITNQIQIIAEVFA